MLAWILCFLSASIYGTYAQSTLCVPSCYASAAPANGAEVFKSVLATYASNDITDSVSTCEALDLTTTLGITDSCYECCITIDSFTELERWSLLHVINENLVEQVVPDLTAALALAPTYIAYASADAIVEDSNCADLNYPRICRLNLITPDRQITTDFFVTVALDTATDTATFRLSYMDGVRWFGIGISTDQDNPAPMVGYALVYNGGIIVPGSLPASVDEVALTGTGQSFVVKQTTQNLEGQTTSIVDGIYTADFTRALNTGDAADFVFVGDETKLNVFAAVDRLVTPTTPIVNNHGALHSVPAFDVLFVPDPSTHDTYWCSAYVVGDCIIALSEATTTTTSEPTTTTPAPTIESLVECVDRKDASTAGGADTVLTVSSVLCGDDDSIYIDIDYSSYSSNWFGVIFGDSMLGDAAVYTTGKTSETARELGLYAYSITGKTAGMVVIDEETQWTQYQVSTDNGGIRVIYKTALSNTPYTMDTETIPVRYALGTSNGGHTLVHHISTSDVLTLSFSADNITTTTQVPGAKGCDVADLLPSSTQLENVAVQVFVDCGADTVTVQLNCSNYDDNWFGVTFSRGMVGDALVYTSGKLGADTLSLYPYSLTLTSAAGVNRDSTSTWTEVEDVVMDGVKSVTYVASLGETPIFSRESESVTVRAAWGSALQLMYHGAMVADNIGNLNLLEGTSTTEEVDQSMIVAHGVLMWLAWALFASVGIYASAFRTLLPAGPTWFKIHRGVQSFVVLLTIIAFILAVVYADKKGRAHFSGSHQIIGLVVVILAVLQPINACVRPPTPSGDETKTTGRMVWEYVHKGLGYVCWLLANVAALLGLLLFGEDLLGYLHIGLWCGLLLVIYIALFAVTQTRGTQEKQATEINEESPRREQDDLMRG